MSSARHKAGEGMNEATTRIKINALLEAAGWRFFADGDKPANIRLEPQFYLPCLKESLLCPLTQG